MLPDTIGFAAGILIAISMIPQLVKSYKTKKVEDVSLLMLFIALVGTALWVIYGYLISSYPIMAMDGFGFFVTLLTLFMKIMYVKRA